MSDSGFDFKKIIDDTKGVLTSPAEYFASMSKEGGFVEPLIKALVYSVIAGVIGSIVGFITIKMSPLGALVGMGTMISSMLWGLVGALIIGIIGLFLGGLLIMLASMISGGNKEYEAAVRVAASLMVISPIRSLFAFLSDVNIWLGMVVSIALSLYGIYLLYIALIKSLGGKELAAKIIAGVLCLFPAFTLLNTILCYQSSKAISEGLKKGASQEQMKKAEEEMNKLLKEAMKEAKKK